MADCLVVCIQQWSVKWTVNLRESVSLHGHSFIGNIHQFQSLRSQWQQQVRMINEVCLIDTCVAVKC